MSIKDPGTTIYEPAVVENTWCRPSFVESTIMLRGGLGQSSAIGRRLHRTDDDDVISVSSGTGIDATDAS
jgi:hypothetical protein